jgi:flagellar biosynthesis/type III secretory pathway chaperone
MKAMVTGIDNKIDELLVVLDKDIQHIQESMSRLNELRSLVIKRDDTALSNYADNESRRQSIRNELANAFGCDVKQMTLSRLEKTLPKGKNTQVTQRKAKLKSLTNKLKEEHLITVLLLSECARLNRLFLNSIFNAGKAGTVIYDSNGITRRQIDTALINLRS